MLRFESYVQTVQPKKEEVLGFANDGADASAYTAEEAHDEDETRVILRHDVDRLPGNSLRLAQLEHSLDIRGSYYFRVVPESYDLRVMEQIAHLGHEIGYHYEDVELVRRRQRSEVRRRKSEVSKHEARNLRTWEDKQEEARGQKSEIRGQK